VFFLLIQIPAKVTFSLIADKFPFVMLFMSFNQD